MWGTPGDHRPDFNLIAVVQHLVFGDEIIAFDHQMSFDDEIQLTQEFLDLLGAFDLDGSSWMAQLDLHGGIIGWVAGTRQEAKGKRRTDKAKIVRL
jgi:hypothetical protein